MLIVLLGPTDVVEERRVEERENPADEPAALAFVSIARTTTSTCISAVP